jgi:hypothetical protein
MFIAAPSPSVRCTLPAFSVRLRDSASCGERIDKKDTSRHFPKRGIDDGSSRETKSPSNIEF